MIQQQIYTINTFFTYFLTALQLTIIVASALWIVCMGYGQQQSMAEDVYEVIVKKLKGEFNVPVSERTRVQKNALVRLWRNRNLYSLSEDGEFLLCAGKPVVLKSKICGIVKKGLDDTRGSGARKLNKRLNEQYSGVSERKVQRTLDSSRRYQLHKARFGNIPIPRPIRAKEVQDQQQVDLLDMGKWKIKHGRFTYRYILTVIDVFSRYTWLWSSAKADGINASENN